MSSPFNRRRMWEGAPKKGAPVRGAGPKPPVPPLETITPNAVTKKKGS